MAFNTRAKIWMNGTLVPWDQAQVHVMSHVLHYGSAIFEGARVYKTPSGPAFFRLDRHLDRMFDSCKIYRMEIPFPRAVLEEACAEVVRVNGFEECYLRPLVYRGYNGSHLAVDPTSFPVDVAIAAYPWGRYLGPDAIEKGVKVRISTWTRLAPNTLPMLAKSAANYMNSQLIKLEARQEGYDEGIALDHAGRLSEGSGENLFLVRRGELYTPPLASSVLPGITRDAIMKLAAEFGYTVHEKSMPREMIYIADEAFFVGTAAEVTPITSVDKVTIGNGERGPITKRLQETFFGIIKGDLPDRYGWLQPVPPLAQN